MSVAHEVRLSIFASISALVKESGGLSAALRRTCMGSKPSLEATEAAAGYRANIFSAMA